MNIMNYYEIVNHKPAESQLRNNTVVNNFKLKFYDIKECKKKEVTTPQVSQKLYIVCWTEVFLDLLSRILGARNIPLAFVVRTIGNEDYEALFDMMNDACYAEYVMSLEEELIKRSSYSHPLFKEYNAVVSYRLEEATKSMVYSSSINLWNHLLLALAYLFYFFLV